MTQPTVPPPLMGALLRMPLDVVQRRMLDALHEHGFDDLAPAHLAVLRYPGPHGQRPVDLAARANMSKQALNYLLGELETRGYLERRVDPEDQRHRRIHVTERGEATREVMRDAVREVEREWAAQLGPKDLERLRALLTKLVGAIQRDGSA